MQGWIKLHRAVSCSAVGAHPEYLAVWVHLLVRASHKPHDTVVGRTAVHLEPGDLVFGRKKFSTETGVSENKVRAALDVLKKLGQITIKSQAKFSVISITNWQKYQYESPANNPEIASNAPATHQHPATNKNGNNGENGENVPVDEIVNLYNAKFPEMPQVKLVTPARRSAVKARWLQHNTLRDIERWSDYFDYIRSIDFLMGRTEKWNGITFDWIINSKNMLKIIEGNYEDKPNAN